MKPLLRGEVDGRPVDVLRLDRRHEVLDVDGGAVLLAFRDHHDVHPVAMACVRGLLDVVDVAATAVRAEPVAA
jgi:hypothetical protein